MFDLETILPKNIRQLIPYSSARSEFSGCAKVYLDANENPFGELNRYPDPQQQDLKTQLAANQQVSAEEVFVGNGSDEVIDLAFRIFCEPHRDKALICEPTYGMYEVGASINNVELVRIPLRSNFSLNVDEVLQHCADSRLKLIFICTPNNPTGNSFKSSGIHKILSSFNGIVFVDEAYIDFSAKTSWVNFIDQYPNLIVCQTMSKAWGLAAARVGIGYAQKTIISLYNRIKPPYNVSALNQTAALDALQSESSFIKNRDIIISARDDMMEQLTELSIINTVFPSDANFILVESKQACLIYEKLLELGTIVRLKMINREYYLRITVGSEIENKTLISQLKKIEL